MFNNFLFSVLLGLLAIGFVSAQPTGYGDVTEILDSSTISVKLVDGNNIRVRIRAVETPLIDQPLGQIVEDHLKRLALNKRVAIDLSAFASTHLISKISIDGADLSLQMIRDGAAWYTPGGRISDLDDANYLANENAARLEKRGIWGIPDLVSPAVLRQNVSALVDPISDPGLARLVIANLGPSIEGVFGDETFTEAVGGCSGKVVGVVDGDTVKILTNTNQQITVRLAGIDAPEKGQDSGMAAKAYLSDLVFGKMVSCDAKKKDRYGRLVAKISVGASDINLQMVKGCMAWHYKEYQSEQGASDRTAYAQAEVQARSNGCGLWTQPNPLKPSDFRRNRFVAAFSDPTRNPDFPKNGADGYNYSLGVPTSSSGGNHSRGTSTSSGSGPVQVRSYTRSDGTFVRGHTRSRPN